MGLITLVLVLALTLLYLGKSLEKKPEIMTQVVNKISDHIDQIAFWGVIWGLIVSILTLVMNYSSGGLLVRLAANVMIVLMALPFAFDRFAEKLQEKVNPAIIDEARNLVGWVTKQEKYIGYAGAVCSVLLFAAIFR